MLPGVMPSESRKAFGSRSRPPESIVAFMGPSYQRVPTKPRIHKPVAIYVEDPKET